MKINKKISETFTRFSIDPDEGLLYLLGLFFSLNVDHLDESMKKKVLMSKVVEYSTTGLKWNIPLFEGQETAFAWVTDEYVKLFASCDKDTNAREATARMKKLFAENPDIRKEEVLSATEMYLSNTNPKYVKLPHYFLRKGAGADLTQDILTWVERLRTSIEQSVDRDNSRKLL